MRWEQKSATKLLLAAFCYFAIFKPVDVRAADGSELSKTSTVPTVSASDGFSAERSGDGGVNGGGGDASAKRIKAIKALIGLRDSNGAPAYAGKSARIKDKLLSLLKTLQTLPPPGEVGQVVQKLIQNGFVEDIEQGLYELKKTCAEGSVEKSATTNKVDRTQDKSIPVPSVCLNVHRLALENAEEEEIVGLLAHEHARHFGLEDTDELGLHPIAEAVATWYRASQAGVGESLAALPGAHLRRSYGDFYLDCSSKKEVTLVFKDLKGRCEQVSFKHGFDDHWTCLAQFQNNICWYGDSVKLRPGEERRISLGLDEAIIELFSTNRPVLEVFEHSTQVDACTATLVVGYGGQKLSEVTLDLSYGRSPKVHLRENIDYEPR